jgi:hypothetical protein
MLRWWKIHNPNQTMILKEASEACLLKKLKQGNHPITMWQCESDRVPMCPL